MKVVVISVVAICIFAHSSYAAEEFIDRTPVRETRRTGGALLYRWIRNTSTCSINCQHNSCNKTCRFCRSTCYCDNKGHGVCHCQYPWPRQISRRGNLMVGDYATPSSYSTCHVWCWYHSCSKQCKEGRAICSCHPDRGIGMCICDSWMFPRIGVTAWFVGSRRHPRSPVFIRVKCKYDSCKKICNFCVVGYCHYGIYGVCLCCD
ncbi:hypothetical protein LSAT2_019008 [Lamellibrachia satsuma]|nr:hypothetical protein LSAT2_019008 [Lamellibrachia satsuma]